MLGRRIRDSRRVDNTGDAVRWMTECECEKVKRKADIDYHSLHANAFARMTRFHNAFSTRLLRFTALSGRVDCTFDYPS